MKHCSCSPTRTGGAHREIIDPVLNFILSNLVMYNNFIVLHGHQHNEAFLRHEFIPVMLDALGLNDASGVIYEILEHDYFSLKEVGDWDKMMPGMINVSSY